MNPNASPQQPGQPAPNIPPVQLVPPNVVPPSLLQNSVPMKTVESDGSRAISTLEHDWKSPAFWIHLAVQIATWLSYLSTTNSSLKIGSLSVSGAAIISYLLHLKPARQ